MSMCRIGTTGGSISRVAAERRVLRVRTEFLTELDAQLPSERGEESDPSPTDLWYWSGPLSWTALPPSSDSLPEAMSGLLRVRVLIAGASPVRAFAVPLTDTGDIELVGVDPDR
jgi:hypothetical protein